MPWIIDLLCFLSTRATFFSSSTGRKAAGDCLSSLSGLTPVSQPGDLEYVLRILSLLIQDLIESSVLLVSVLFAIQRGGS